MPKTLHSADNGFEQELENYLSLANKPHSEVTRKVAAILADVAKRGDAALIEYTRKFDHPEATVETLRISESEMEEAERQCAPELLEALGLACQRIEAYHRKQLPADVRYKDPEGITLGWQWRPIEAVGLYVPGGKASYPSSVLMNAIPARIAGVTRMVVAVPAPKGELNPLVLAAARIAGIHEIYRIGGAQAIAALAYGTKTIPRVDKIAGPGNAFVAEAKRQLYGHVGIDMVAGPSEILVIADGSCNAEWIAADLLSQAEHDVQARSILITDNAAYAEHVEQEAERILSFLPRAHIAKISWNENGLIILTQDLHKAVEICNRIAPEHAEIATEEPEALLPALRHAGAIFLGHRTPEAIGDYTAGPSHVLPTAGSARFSSGLSVLDFMKRSSIVGCDEAGFNALAEATTKLAEAEGLGAHALSVARRAGIIMDGKK